MGTSQRVLIVDDEQNIRSLLAYSLEKAGYEVLEAADGLAAMGMISERKPDLVVLDVMMPGMDGHEVLMRLRAANDTSRMPVIMLTARGADADKVYGLNMGADDYMSKPFSVNELMARVRALLRRASSLPAESGQELSVGPLRIDKAGRRVFLHEGEAILTLKEYDLLLFLAEHPGVAFSREKLLGEVWGYDYFGDMRTVDVHVTHLRGKIGPASSMIETVRGVGYRFAPSANQRP